VNLTLFTGSANLPLAHAVAQCLGTTLGACELQRFPDGELHVALQQSVRGDDVYLIQPTSPPVEAHLLELLFLADACRRSGAARLTAVLPYFGYARQDRRANGREALGGRVIADLLATSGLNRFVAVDLHTAAIEGFFAVPLEHLSAVPALAEAVRSDVNEKTVVVAPDLGAVKRAARYASLLERPVAIVHKIRVSGGAVTVTGITGDVRGCAPVIVDDMISTGGTIEAAVKALLAAGCLPDVTVVACHALLVGPAASRLQSLPLHRLVVSDSVVVPSGFPIPTQTVSLAPILADAILRLHREESLGDLAVME
jgi:ribose-phosphate pyrophosphokinase